MDIAVLRSRLNEELESIEELLNGLKIRKHVVVEEGIYKVFVKDNIDDTVLIVGGVIDKVYLGVERILILILNHFNENMEKTDEWHKNLLVKSKLETEFRSSILSKDTYRELDGYRSFVHVVRRNYPKYYNTDMLFGLVKKVFTVYVMFREDVVSFIEKLDED